MVMCDTTELFAQSLWHSIKELNYIFNSIELEMVVRVWIHRYLYIVMLISNSVPTTITIVIECLKNYLEQVIIDQN